MSAKTDRARGRLVLRLVFGLLWLMGAVPWALAGSPRWVSGAPYFSKAGLPLAWYTSNLTYFTDPGDLGPTVSHSAADQLVASAAAVWNVPMTALVLSQGGQLAEHVTGAMLSAGGAGTVTMPPDVQSANWQTRPLAILYDTDGSVIDALLGAGGSDPSGCLQNGVVESVDLFGKAATIEHAVLILNGRCTGAAPELQLQLKYQLVRAFGRVLGLGWSQLNDNVFTNSPTPTYAQAQHWPVMHPIDIACGPYTYQCMPDPFTLRADDISGLALLYFLDQGQGAAMPGKQDSLQKAELYYGHVFLPNGQGMYGVNVTSRRHPFPTSYVEPWQETSSVTGYAFRRQTSTAVQAQDGSVMQSIGTTDASMEGFWQMRRVPDYDGYTRQLVQLDTEPVNPLYTGIYALAAAAASSTTIAPSGSPLHMEGGISVQYYLMYYDQTATTAVASCKAGSDGTATAPMTMPSSGWWTGYMCGWNHSAWTGLTMQPNRTLTVELTALDETGAASAVKMMPMIGVWSASDPVGPAPTVAMNALPFNTAVTGTSSVLVTQPPSTSMRMAFVDQRGLGRPDFAYQARVLYADSIQPANVGPLGGTVVISGSGFRSGMQVLVNGVAGRVTAVTPNTLTAVVPALSQLGGEATVATVAVSDPSTGGTSTMLEALGYGAAGERLQLMSGPANPSVVGRVATTAFAVRVLGADGVTPSVGESVTLSVTTGTAVLGACGAAQCRVLTDSNGVASTTVTPGNTGTVELMAATALLTVRTSFTAITAPDTITLVSAPASPATVGMSTVVPFAVRLLGGDGVTPRAGQTVLLTAEAGAAQFPACGTSSCPVRTDATGVASAAVVPLVAGTITLDASAAAGVVHASFSAAPEQMKLVSAPAGLLTAGVPIPVAFAVRVVGGDGVTPVAGETVSMAVTGPGASLGSCGLASCVVTTDGAGLATSPVVVTGAGAVTLSASAQSGTVLASFRTGFESMQVLQAPTGSYVDGVMAAPAMVVRVLGPDGVTPVVGETVSFAVTAGRGELGLCGVGSCSAVTGAAGTASMTVTLESVGAIVVTATGRNGAQTVTLTGVPQPDVLQVVSGLPATVQAGGSPVAVAVRLTLPDGITAVPEKGVVFTLAEGMGVLGCGASSCRVVTDAAGEARMTLVPVLAGQLVMLADAQGLATKLMLSTTVVAVAQSVVSLEPVQYVAEGLPAQWTAKVGVSEGAGSSEGVEVLWAGRGGLGLSPAMSVVRGGLASAVAEVSGLGAGVRATGTACAWGGVCGEVAAEGVSAAAWQMEVVSGAGQTGAVAGVPNGVSAANGPVSPVVVRVTDGLGHPVLGVPVTVYQTVVAAQQACDAVGRCTGGEVLGSGSAGLITDAAGMISVQPMVVGNGPSVTKLTAVAGTQGMVTVAVPH